MTAHPSFIYDQYRPGIETEAQAEIWRDNRETLERIMHGSAKQIGASIIKIGLGGAEDDRTRGDATILHLDRAEPPMTAEEARKFGDGIVAAWTAVVLVGRVPEFCDTVFTLQAESDSTPSS